ncbi:hypothetical protein RI129_002847 [Pyrocoelia pectoralis]|uniref:MADF domain-containing protein n=1 Tax=Pyrocoelia pectoralis TaxID=417401 RepID=A0AAN7VGS1_9COLE
MNWSDEKIISFLEMYRERSLLWGPTDAQYKNKNKRHDGLMEIAVSFGIEKVEVEKKIKNLQRQFCRKSKKENDLPLNSNIDSSRDNVSHGEYTELLFFMTKFNRLLTL